MVVQADQQRILQLVSAYSPASPPQLALGFGDYLSLLWCIDNAAGEPGRVTYYRRCADAVVRSMNLEHSSISRVVQNTPAGSIYVSLENVPYRGTARFVDAPDRRVAIRQLLSLRAHIVGMGTDRQGWTRGWPGSRLSDVELRERLFSVFFTAFDSQFSHFSRLILVIDIVLQEILIGSRQPYETSLISLIKNFGYPDPDEPESRNLFDS
jgi:hypothetical protein